MTEVLAILLNCGINAIAIAIVFFAEIMIEMYSSGLVNFVTGRRN